MIPALETVTWASYVPHCPFGQRRQMGAVTRCYLRGMRAGRARHWLIKCQFPALILVPALLTGGQARAQLIDRYFPANIPAYQDWATAALAIQTDSAYAPTGVRAGSFVIHPSVSESLGYDSNPFGNTAAQGTAESDTSISVAADSDWSRNGLNAAVTADRIQYFDFPSQSFTTWTASAGGVIDYAEDQIDIGYSHVNGVSLPTDVGSFSLRQPVIDEIDDLRVTDTIGPGPLILVPSLDGQLYRFNPVSGSSQTAFQQGLFNRNAVNGSITAGYEFAGGHNVIVIISDSQVGYQNGSMAVRPADYNDVSVLAGLEYKQSALIAYRALVGYEVRSSTGGGISSGTISAPAAELDVIWKPTALTSLTGKVSQSLQDEPSGNSQGLTLTQVGLTLDHSLRRNVSLEGSVQYNIANSPADSGNQSTFTVGASANWSIDRHWVLSMRYQYTSANDTSQSVAGFDRQQIFLQAKFQM